MAHTPLRQLQEDTPLGPLQGHTPLGPLQGHTPLGPLQEYTPLGPLQEYTPLGPLQEYTPLGPLQEYTPLGPLQDRWSPSTGTSYLRTSGTVTAFNVRAPEVRGAIELSPRELANTRSLLGIPQQVGFRRVIGNRLQQLHK
ncbi:hypothetical protein MTO96_010811 [Rhipicephalus appendiculatus]